MKCADVKKELELMFEAVKPGTDALNHIKGCEKCGLEYEAMLKITACLSKKENVKLPSNFNRSVWDKIGEPAPTLFGNIFRPVFVFGGAAAAALLVFMVFFAKPGTVNKQDNFAAKPVIVKEKIVKKEVIKEQAPLVAEEAPVAAKPNEAPIEQGELNEVSPGKMPVLVKSTGADREFVIKQEEETGKVSAASVTKRPGEPESPLLVKNNVVKPLQGQAMTMVYKVESTCNVLIRIYNRKGEPVKTIVQAMQPPGIYTEVWSGEDDKNMAVGDGIYIVHVKTCLTEQKIKAMVVK